MASASDLSLNVQDYGVTTAVPDDDFARLMYYLHCVTVGVGLDFLPDDLVRYEDYQLLSPTRLTLVFKTAVELGPEVFIDKILFRDDEAEVTGTSLNSFVSIAAACDIVSLQCDVEIAGKVQNVTKVMFFKSSWLKKFFTDPAERIARAILGTKHCTHCDGEDPICTCTDTCRRPPESKCHSYSDLGAVLLEFLMTPSASNSTAAPRPAPSSQDKLCQCGRQFAKAILYRCTVCKDYDICSLCYYDNVHDLTHPFMQISEPGVNPIHLRLSPRSEVPTAPSSNTPSTATRSVPPRNPPLPLPLPPCAHAKPATSPPPYTTETLCRRAWDTHCDSTTITELDTFLSNQNVSVTGCRDVDSIRQKAKAAFEPPTRPPQPPDAAANRFKKDDKVVLTRLLNRGEMNGNTATVISVDGSKALVRVEALDRTFRIKLENLKMYDELE